MKFKIQANRELYYEVNIEASSKDEALEIFEQMETNGELEGYAQEFYPLEIGNIEEID